LFLAKANLLVVLFQRHKWRC